MNDSAKENIFTDEVRKFQTSDPAHADLFNDVNTSLLGNDIYLKEHLDNLENPSAEEIPIPDELEEIKDGDSYNVLIGKLIKAVNVLLNISEQVEKLQDTTFNEAQTRANIVSGEEMSVMLGKIRKWFSDLKAVAFSGSYNDLSNKPTIPSSLPANGGNADTVDGKHAYAFVNRSERVADRILVTDANGDVQDGGLILASKLIYLQGIQENIQNVLNALKDGSARDNTKMMTSYWHWNGQSGQPSWLWGGNNANDYYVYNPANFNVNSAVNDSDGRKIIDTYATKAELASVGAASGDVISLRGDVQIRSGLWYKVGRMVVFTIHYYISAEEIGAGTNIITGLPTPLSGYWYGLSGSGVDTYAVVNGVLSPQNNRGRGDHRISGSYIC